MLQADAGAARCEEHMKHFISAADAGAAAAAAAAARFGNPRLDE